MKFPPLPPYVSPTVSPQIENLEFDNPGVISAIRHFLEGTYDPTANMFADYLEINKHRIGKATEELQKKILAAQGAQRIYGGAAGNQLNQALIDKIKDDLDREKEFLWKTLNQIIDNRKFGIQSGNDTIGTAKNYAIQKAAMQNDYNMKGWINQTQQAMYRDANPSRSKRILENFTNSLINQGTSSFFKNLNPFGFITNSK